MLDDSSNRVVVEGGAGTGKTILAIFLFKMLASEQSVVNEPEQDSNLSILQGLVDKAKVKYPNPHNGVGDTYVFFPQDPTKGLPEY